MANYLSTELGGSANQTTAPVGYKPRASVYGARVKRMRATITLNTQTISDTLILGYLPAGSTFAYGVITSSVSLGTSTIAIGTSSSTGKYRSASTFTPVDTPTLFGNSASIGLSDPANTADEQVICTIATASLPASGTLIIDMFYSSSN